MLGMRLRFKTKEIKLIGSLLKTAGFFINPTYSIISSLPDMVIQFWLGGTTVRSFASVPAVFEGVFVSLLSCSVFSLFAYHTPASEPIYL